MLLFQSAVFKEERKVDQSAVQCIYSGLYFVCLEAISVVFVRSYQVSIMPRAETKCYFLNHLGSGKSGRRIGRKNNEPLIVVTTCGLTNLAQLEMIASWSASGFFSHRRR